MSAGHFGQNFAVFANCMPYWNYHISMGHEFRLEGRDDYCSI